MGEQTAISWCDHTMNPWMGCTKVSPACDNCYAESLGKRTGRVQWGDDAVRVVTSDAYWKNPIKWDRKAAEAGRPALVFCASLADVFEDRPELNAPRARLWDLIEQTPHLIWLLLTKRPENVRSMVPVRWLAGESAAWAHGWPGHVWVGTTVEDQEHADLRIPALLEVPAPVRFLSCEPLLGRVDLTRVDGVDVLDSTDTGWDSGGPQGFQHGPTIRWVIAGGESGPGHRPLDLDAVRLLRDDCAAHRVPFLFKQHGGRTPTAGGDLLDGVQHKAWPEEARRG